MHILSNISRSKGNQTIEIGQFIKYNKKNIFLKDHAENEAGALILDPFLLFKKAFVRDKSKSFAA